MSLVSQLVPTLYNGVSQQSPALRHSSQCEALVNAYPTVVRGVSTRPPTQHIAKLIGTAVPANAFVHFINRGLTEQYVVIIETGGVVKVYELGAGTTKTVTILSGATYLTSSNPRADFTAVTVADYTFIVNRTVTVAEGVNITPGTLTGERQSLYELQNSATQKIDPPAGLIKITGDADSFDEFYVLGYNTGNKKVWEEVAEPGIPLDIDNTTMPVQLVRTAGGSFEASTVNWANRLVGDTNSNSMPSFVGREIKDIMFFRNRLGLISGENVILSEAGQFFNFFRTTVVDLLDSDPIDVAVSHNRPSTLNHAVPFDKTLFLFADQAQFALDSDNVLTPRTAAIDQTTEFEASGSARPVGSGSTMFFVTEGGGYSAVREYFIDPETLANNAADVTAHVPKYVPKNVSLLASSTNYDLITALSDDEPNALYIYKFYWSGNEKAQSAWGKWEFGTNVSILGLEIMGNEMYLLINRNDGTTDSTYIEKIDLEVFATVDPSLTYNVHLDERATITGTYDGGADKTTFSLPFDLDVTKDIEIVTGAGYAGSEGAGFLLPKALYTRVNPYTVEIPGRYDYGVVYVGTPYEMRYEFSQIFVRSNDEALLDGDLRLRYFSIYFTDTAVFQTSVTALSRDPQDELVLPANLAKFTSRTLGINAVIGTPVIVKSGKHKFPIMARSDGVKVELKSNSYVGSHFNKLEWEGNYVRRSKKL